MHEDIEFSDNGIPLNVGIAYSDLGKIESYVLSFEGYSLEISRLPSGKIFLLDNGIGIMALPLPIIEAMMRLDLAALVPATEAKEEE